MGNMRKVALGVKGMIAEEVLRSVSGQLSDGIWENARNDEYWYFCDIENSGFEVYFNVSADRQVGYYGRNPYPAMSDEQIRKYWATKLRETVKEEAADWKLHHNGEPRPNGEIVWKRDCTAVLDYVGYDLKITVADCYRVYDALMGRKKGE